MSARHIGLDVREDAVHWVRSRIRRGRLEPERSGRTERDPSAPDAAVAEILEGVGRGCRVEVALRDPAMLLQREEPPPVRRRELAKVAARRAERLAREIGDDAFAAWSCAGPLWIAAVSGESAREELAEWEGRGVDVHRMQSRHLALGRVAALLAGDSDDLVALFDLQNLAGTCVVADRHGWVFGREFAVRFTSERGRTESESGVGPEPTYALALEAEAAEEDKEVEGAEPEGLERLAERAERIVIELRRTFRYVGGELRLGDVRRVFLAGDDHEIADLTSALAGALELPVVVLDEALPEGIGRGLATAGALALGLALAPDTRGGSLVPPEIRRRRAAKETSRRLVVTLVGVVATASTAAVILDMRADSLEAATGRMRALWDRESARRAFVAEAQRSRAESARIVAAFSDLDRPEPPWAALLEVLSRLAPEDVFVERIHARRSDEGWLAELAIEAVGAGNVPPARSIADFIEKLRGSPLFAIDAIEQEESVAQVSTASARARFLLRGRLAPVEPRPMLAAISPEASP